jgi:hypothetical protein
MPEAETRTLIAKWKPEQDGSVALPHAVYWSDGSPASAADYLLHLTDTHTFIVNEDSVALHIFPDIVADVHYDPAYRHWVVEGAGVRTTALELSGENASDESILAELATLPTVYRARIHR